MQAKCSSTASARSYAILTRPLQIGMLILAVFGWIDSVSGWGEAEL